MNRILRFTLTAALVLGLSAQALATDIKIKGTFDFGFGWYSNNDDFRDTAAGEFGGEDNFDALQRLRFQIDFIASEQLSGTVQFEIGDISWGSGGGDTWGADGNSGNGSGGAMGTDGVNVETRHMYIDWIVPETDLSIRMGLLPFALPFFANGPASGNFILDDDLAGIVASYTFNDYVSANLAWLRPWDPFSSETGSEYSASLDHDTIDLVALTLPLTFADYGLEITPWGMYGFIGEVDNTDVDAAGNPTSGNYGSIADSLSGAGGLGAGGEAWWAGLALNVNTWDPFFFAADVMYGRYSSDDVHIDNPDRGQLGWYDNDRDGWAVSVMLGYKLECLTPTLFGWYGSGISDADDENFMDGLLPVVSPDFGFTSFGWSNSYDLFRDGNINGNNISGTWGIGLGLEEIKLMEGLTNALRVAYFQGTNDDSLGQQGSFWSRSADIAGSHLYTTKDWGLEVNLDTSYEIMEGLTLYNQIAYIYLNVDDTWNAAHTQHWENDTDDAWEFAVGFEYAF